MIENMIIDSSYRERNPIKMEEGLAKILDRVIRESVIGAYNQAIMIIRFPSSQPCRAAISHSSYPFSLFHVVGQK
jgi:hypothetical protein